MQGAGFERLEGEVSGNKVCDLYIYLAKEIDVSSVKRVVEIKNPMTNMRQIAWSVGEGLGHSARLNRRASAVNLAVQAGQNPHRSVKQRCCPYPRGAA